MTRKICAAVPAILLATAIASQALILVDENFTGYIDGAELGGTTNQTALGTGLTGSWTGSGYFKSFSVGLSMPGVASSGGSAYLVNPGNQSKTVSVAFEPSLSTGTFHGSYLFSINASGANARTMGAIGVGAANGNDNNVSFVWAGNGYNNSTGVEGPGLRVKGSEWTPATLSLTNGETYVYLFEFNVANQTTTGWVLSADQLANFYGSLDAATLNAATADTTDANGITWRGSATNAGTYDMSSLILFGLGSTDPAFDFTYDEIRISDTSLIEAVAVPEPSIADLALGFGVLVFGWRFVVAVRAV